MSSCAANRRPLFDISNIAHLLERGRPLDPV